MDDETPDSTPRRWFLAGKSGWRQKAGNALNKIFPPAPPFPETRLTKPVAGMTLFLFLLGVAALSILLVRAPAPLPESAPGGQFSAARAMRHVQALAAQPRPFGSVARAQAQGYLIAQLDKLGLETEVQRTVGVNGATVARVENVLARLPGSQAGRKAVLLNAHYDSADVGFGASDDATGVATLLETARALKVSGQTLANDVVFLFDDCEELGCPGQTAFLQEHPWAKDIGLVLLFDPAILSGAVYAYPSHQESWLVSQYARAAPHPLASSFSIDLFPDPDAWMWDVWRDVPYGMLYFRTQPTGAYYHSLLDNVGTVDRGSLQNYGVDALSLVRHFGNLDLAAAQGEDAVFFNVIGTYFLVHYTQTWNIPLAVIAALALIATLVFALRWKRVSLRGVLLGTVGSVAVVVLLAATGYLIWRLLLVAYPQYRLTGFLPGSMTYNGIYYWLAFMALGAGLAALVHAGLRTRIRDGELAWGALFLLLVGEIVAVVLFPGSAYAFTWALLFSSLGLWGWFFLGRHQRTTIWSIVWLALFSVPIILLTVPLMSPGGSWSRSIYEIWIPMLILGVLLGVLAPHLAIIARPRKSWFPALMGLVVVGFLVAGHLTSGYAPTRPLRDGIAYVLVPDEGKAYWYSGAKGDSWTGQFLTTDTAKGDYHEVWPWEGEQFYRAPAPVTDLPTPQVESLGTTGSGEFRLHVASPPGAWQVDVFVMPDPVPGLIFYVDGRRVRTNGELYYFDPPDEGFELVVGGSDLDTIALRVVNRLAGLPTLPGLTYSSRPDWIMPWGDYTAVAKTFSFTRTGD